MRDAETPHGYNGKVLHVDLTQGTVEVETPDTGFYRTYLGGGLLGTYYVMRGTRPGVDALAPDNVLVFAPSVATGAPVMGVSRFNVSAKSPLTGAIGDSQCGGDWGARLKHAGFDAVVVTGRSAKPAYLWIDAGKAEIRDATHLWGRTTGEAQTLIRQELGDEHAEIAQIGAAGENLVRFACITGGLSHFAGRTGMGAVMGSKNLKAIAVRGRRQYGFHDEEAVAALAKKGVAAFKASEGMQAFHEHGTGLLVSANRDKGNIVTRNSQEGDFAGLAALTGERMTETILKDRETCYACAIRCKRVVATDSPYSIEGQYGGPEFETLMMLGPNLGIGSLDFVAKASEICNKHTMDTISAGGVIALAMECFERGIVDEQTLSGLRLRFGEEGAALDLLEMIARRRGVGDLLAEGPAAVWSAWGNGSQGYAVQTKNQPFPAHMARIKPSMALIYAVHPSGPDHMACEHDWIGASDDDVSRPLGITDLTDLGSLDRAKVKATLLSSLYYSAMDSLTVCDFVWGPGSLYTYNDLCELVRCTTGWGMNMWELMRAGERRLNLMKAFNAREGLDGSCDELPPRMFEPLRGGAGDGRSIDPDRHREARGEYYAMMGWDPASGRPLPGKLMELGLDWVVEHAGSANAQEGRTAGRRS
jgi:aldehyde:ferredoxin oxidoreductase